MIAVFKLIHGQKCYLYDEAGNIQLFPDVIAAKVGLAMNGIIEDRINSGEFLFEHWEDPEEVKREPTENEKKMQEQIEQLDKRVKELEEIIGAMRIAKIIDTLCDLGSCPQTLPDDYIRNHHLKGE